MRSQFKVLHGALTSKYTILINNGTLFLPSIIVNLCDNIHNSDKCVMTSGFCINLNHDGTYDRYHYAKPSSMITKYYMYDEIGHTCVFSKCEKCKKKRKQLNMLYPKYFLCGHKNNLNVLSLHSSLCCIKTKVYNNIKLNENDSDAIFCYKIRQFGNIVLDPTLFFLNLLRF